MYYYPFGMQMPGREFAANNSYRYGFNGKENDKETKTQDYGFRIYNPGLGKFLSVDPLTESYPWYTPYQFAGNTPIKFIDLDGLEPADPGSAKGLPEARREGQTFENLHVERTEIGNLEWTANKVAQIQEVILTKYKKTDLITRFIFGIENSKELKNYQNNSSRYHEAIGNTFGDYKLIFGIELKSSLGVQGGAKFGVLSGEAGIFTTDIGKVGFNTETGTYAKWGDGKGHNFIGASASLLHKKLSIGGKADYVTDKVICESCDLIEFFSETGKFKGEFTIGPKTHWGPNMQGKPSFTIPGKLDKLNVGLKTRGRLGNVDSDCIGCLDTSIGIKALLGLEFKIKLGFKPISK